MTTVVHDLKPCDKTLQADAEREKQRQKEIAQKKLKWEKKLRKSGRIDDEKPSGIQRKPAKEYSDRGMNAPRKADKATEKFTKMDMADVYLACGLTPAPRPCPPPLPKIKRKPSSTR